MNLSEARRLKVGDTLYHRSVFHPNGKRCTTVVKSLVKVVNHSPPIWGILVQDDDMTQSRTLSGKYAFNWSVTPIQATKASALEQTL